MAECRCGECEHCTNASEPWTPPPKELLGLKLGLKPMRLLTKSRLAFLRANAEDLSFFTEVLDAYETAVHLLEEVVTREPIDPARPVCAMDVAWLKLREIER